MDTLTVSLRLQYVLLIFGLLCTAIASTVFLRFEWAASPKEVMPVITAGIALTALGYAAMNLHLNASIKVEELRLKRLEYAMNFIDLSTKPETAKAIRLIAQIRKESQGKKAEEIVQLIDSDPARTEALIMVCNYFERLGIIIRLNAADEQALKDYYSVTIRRHWHFFNIWINAKRAEVQTTDLYCELEQLANRWR